MRLAELCAATGVPPATVKYYLREGLLPVGERVSATRAISPLPSSTPGWTGRSGDRLQFR